MAEDKSDNAQLRNSFYSEDPLLTLELINQRLSKLNASTGAETSTIATDTSAKISRITTFSKSSAQNQIDNDPNNNQDHSLWWLNTRRRCHKHINKKRSIIRRKHI